MAFETLFDPQGNVAAYSLLGTNQSGFGHVEVREPDGGHVDRGDLHRQQRPLHRRRSSSPTSPRSSTPPGRCRPRPRTLAPGQSGTFKVTVTAGQAGDEALSLHLGTGGSTDGGIPIVAARAGADHRQRRLVRRHADRRRRHRQRRPGVHLPVQRAGGRAVAERRHQAAPTPTTMLKGFLVDPNGEPLDLQSTASSTPTTTSSAPARPCSSSERTRSPGCGRWYAEVAGPVDGAHLSEPFTGAISFAAPAVSQQRATELAEHGAAAGQPVTATITVTNTGNSAKDYFADPRLNGRVPQVLLGADVNDVALPLSLTRAAALAGPARHQPADRGRPGHGADHHGRRPGQRRPRGARRLVRQQLGRAARGARGRSRAVLRPPRADRAVPGPATGTANLAAVANTNPFDSAISASTGDIWAQSVNPAAPYTPLTWPPARPAPSRSPSPRTRPRARWSAASSAWTPSTWRRPAVTS